MTPRRYALVIGLAAIVAGFSQRVGASGPVELEADGYGGTGSAHFSRCDAGSATLGLKYGGLGVQARFLPSARAKPDDPAGGQPALSPSRPEAFAPPHGTSFSLAVASEVVNAQLTCSGKDCAGFQPNYFPLTSVRSGGRIRLGYDWTYFGIHAGLLLNQAVGETGVGPFASSGFPDLCLRAGPSDIAWFEMGLGAYNLPTILRPGAYIGGGVRPAPPYMITAHYGAHLQAALGDETAGRFDFDARGPLSDRFQLGGGVAVTTGDRAGLHPEGRIFATTEF